MSFFNLNDEAEESVCHQFLRDSTIHGVKYLAQRQRPFAERVCWILILTGSLGASGYFIYGIVEKYNKSPVIVSFQPSQTSVMDVPFPAITVCSVNRFKKSSLLQFFAAAQSEDNETVYLAHLILRQLDHICSLSNAFSNFFNYSMNETRVNVCERFGVGCGTHAGFSPNYKFPDSVMLALHSALPTCQEMIPLCLWEGQKQDCGIIFQQFVTDMGFCCIFNAAPRQYIVKETANTPGNRVLDKEEDKFWKSFNIDDLLESDRSNNRKYEKYLKYQSKAGQGSGLSFLVNTDMHEYFCDNHDSYGFRIHTHSPIEIPHVAEFGVGVGPSSEMFISLQADITKSDKDIRSLPVRRRKCYYSHEQPLDSFHFYTTSNCLDQCLGEETARSCNCVRVDMGLKFSQSTLQNVSFCEGTGIACAKRIMISVSKHGTDHVCPYCKPSCNQIDYVAQLSSLPLRKGFTIKVLQSEEDEGNGPDNFVRPNASIVHIFFGSDNVYSRIRKNLYSFNDLFAHIGGILGLFLGMSVISVIEPINMLYRKIFGPKNEGQDNKLKNMIKQLKNDGNQHFYAKSPAPIDYNEPIMGDPWRKKYPTFGNVVPDSRIYPFGYNMHRY